ncbi:nudix hydrolase 2-like, partial [Trifolium medium]|nr:nudix hydrolase 2-like [Trifolium medium]
AGFSYHHAESDYLMLVYRIPDTTVSIPANASHRVGIGAFVVNNKNEVIIHVQILLL